MYIVHQMHCESRQYEMNLQREFRVFYVLTHIYAM